MLIKLRKKIINGFNRALYLGRYVDFPAWCTEHGVWFDKSFYRRLLANRPIAKIERCKVRLGDLRTRLFGTQYAMKDSLAYRSLKGEVKYSEYVAKVHNIGDHSLDGRNDRWPFEMMEWLDNDKDSFKARPVIVNPKDAILDGQHRSCVLLLKYGEDYKIDAVRIYTLPAEGSLLQKTIRKIRAYFGGSPVAKDANYDGAISSHCEEYDLIVSLGGNCSVAQQARHRGLRNCSLPLDWAFMPDEKPLRILPDLLATRFEQFCRYENMEEIASPPEERGHIKCKLKDRYSGYHLIYNFTAPFSDRTIYERDLAVLRRRVDRMYDLAGNAKKVLFAITTVFEFDTALLEPIYTALLKTFPGVSIKLVVMQFSSGTCEEFDLMDGKIHVTKLERAWNHVYDTQLTAPDWSWLDCLSISGTQDPIAKRKRDWKIKYAYKLWMKLGKYLERNNTACSNMRFNQWA